MDIRFKCWKCRNKLAVDIAGSGLSVPCPLCGQQINVPEWKRAMAKANDAICKAAVDSSGYHAPRLAAEIKAQFHYDGYVCLEDSRNTAADFGQQSRIELVLKINIGLRRGFMRWNDQMHADTIDFWPAWGLQLDTNHSCPRRISSRWKASGGQCRRGKYLALKTDSVWTKFSIFGCPWPPFDFYDDVRVRSLSSEETRASGLVKKNIPPSLTHGTCPIPFIKLEDDAVTEFMRKHSPD